MTTDKTTPFEQQYQAALLLHLTGRSRNRPTSPAARELGVGAFDAGMSVLELVRMHDQVMSALAEDIPTNEPVKSNQPTASAVFLLQSLTSMEERILHAHVNDREALRLGEEILEKKSAIFIEQLAESQRLQKQAQHLAHQVLLAQEEERREISRELHDEVAQILAGINVRLEALRKVGDLSLKGLEQSIEQTQQMIEASVVAVHRYARNLRPAMLDDLGLIPSLRSCIKELPHDKDLKVRLKTIPEVETMDNVRRTVFYRVAKEALMNVVRHAEAQAVTVTMRAIPDGICLKVQDDGKGFKMSKFIDHKSLGLLGMKERVEMVEGKFSIASKPGKGTTLLAEIPYISTSEEEQE